ncbi:uncharacterized protein LOC127008181 [Eriocheir sinensis]|uniref:uncharacterized protein LOC127008181 n=1 Tax=Eriocheir sinensis TaxID=95602 RepID=UPI0021C7C49B|nr:uncharacterized protein LOC127008181 [Eriocheir sinensis]
MQFFVVWTFVMIMGNLAASSQQLAGGVGPTGVLKDGVSSASLEKAGENHLMKDDEGVLKYFPKLSDLEMNTSLENGANDSIKTVERKVFDNRDETGHVTGNKTVVEKTTETDVQPNGNVSKITETQVVIDEEGKESAEKSVTESETLTQTTPNNRSLTQTVDVKNVTDEEGNEINEEVIIKKEATVQPLTSATEVTKEILPGNKTNQLLATEKEEKLPLEETIRETCVESKNDTDKSDGRQKVERTEKTIEILPGNKTNEMLVTEKEEKLPSQEIIKEIFVETKNVTENGDGPLIVERTEKTKEILPANETNESIVTEKEERLPSQESISMTSVEESRNASENGDGPQKIERTEKTKEILPGNKTNEIVVTEKEERLPSQESISMTSVEESRNASENGDGPQKIERTEKTKEILPGNKTNEVIVTEKEEKLPSHETIKETSVETKNVTENVEGPLVVERTEKTKEILPGNETNEISVTEKEEKLPSHETIKETSVESRNVTENGDIPLIVDRTEKTKELLPGNETNEVVVTEKEEKLPSRETAVTPPKVVKKIRRRKACRCDSLLTLSVVTEELIERIARVVLKEMTTE